MDTPSQPKPAYEDKNRWVRRRNLPTIPSDTERRAIRGYSAQYALAASIIYDALIDGEVEWIRVADPEAGLGPTIQAIFRS